MGIATEKGSADGMGRRGPGRPRTKLASDRPPCPRCESARVTPKGKTKAGSKRYTCMDCGKTFTHNPTERRKSKTPTKTALRMRRQRERNKQWMKKAHEALAAEGCL